MKNILQQNESSPETKSQKELWRQGTIASQFQGRLPKQQILHFLRQEGHPQENQQLHYN